MKKVVGLPFSLLFMSAWLFVACRLSPKSPPATTALPSPVVVVTDVTKQPTEIPSPPAAPSGTPVPPTREPSPIPFTVVPTLHPVVASSYGPVGFIVDPHDGIGFLFYNLDGSLITEMLAPGLSDSTQAFVHFAGSWKGDLMDVPVVYFSTEGPSNQIGTAWLRILAGESETMFISAPEFFSLAGMPGQPVLAYSTLDFAESQLRSRLYAANLSKLSGASPLFVISDPDGYVVRAVAVDAEEERLKGVWYTMAAWGIGGDIVFEPRKGLKYLDMTTGTVIEILNRDMVAWDVSLDRNWVAYSTISGPMSILNRQSAGTFTYPLRPDSNRGAGNAVLSPEGQYIAWVEASGWRTAANPDLSVSIRIATTSGVHIADICQTAFENIASSNKITWIEPVGWLNEQILMVQVGFEDRKEAALIRMNVDGSNTLYLATGTFVAFLYP